MAAKKARDVIRSKTLLDGAGMPDKLKDCSSKNREERELFIVEGDSAGGSAVTARDPLRQAILPIRGKILNVERARLDKMLKNLEVQALISAIGAGVGEEFDVEKRRYDKICILADADVDGLHIRTLLLTFFFRQMSPLVEHGHVYICQPPLYSTEVGKAKIYLKDDHAKDVFLRDNPNHKKDFGRLKGLGEMDAEELRITTMEDGLRTLLQVTRRAGRAGRRGRVHPDGRRRRGPQAVHRQQRQGREVPGHLMSDQTPPSDDGPVRTAIEPIEIQEEMEPSFLDYAMSVITARALPDARDGLKPVHRRILYGMDDLGARPDRSHMKCARITGDVMGKYHPHGEGAIYDALVRMAQDFSLRHPLVDGHGNFGSPDFGPAASRYTECRLEPAGHADARRHRRGHRRLQRQLLGRRRASPIVLPARFPNLLVNGSQGIAVGMATNIPPHNLGEVIDATVHLIDNPEATPDDLMQFVQGPDFPTGALIMGRQGILDAYRTGKGSIRLRAVCEIEEGSGRGGDQIVVTEMPYQTSISVDRGPHRGAGADARRSRASATSTTSRPGARRASSSS